MTAPPPSRRRSRTVRAAALVTLGLGAAGCDDVPADLPGATEARLDACRAAHRQLGEDPARCDALERAIASEHAGTRPQFTTVAACETLFGQGACEGETLAAAEPGWRPTLAGWARVPGQMAAVQPVVRDAQGQAWALPEAASATAGGVALLPAPRPVTTLDYPAHARAPLVVSLAYYRLAPLYPDEESCKGEWQSCERFALPLPTRFATEAACRTAWSQCVEVEVPEASLTAAADGTAAAPASGQGSSGAGTGSGRSIWWVGYNSGWRHRYGGGIGPRYQGWTWSADRRPTAAYRPATGTGPLRAWDRSSRSLGQASRMGTWSGGSGADVSGSTVSRPTSAITRAGFGSTGRAYSSGG